MATPPLRNPLCFTTALLLICLLLAPFCSAQFGVGGKRKPKTSFQELNERAARQEQQQQQQQGAGDLDDLMGSMDQLQDLWKQVMPDGGTAGAGAAQYEKLMADAMEELSKMSPEQLQKQMQEAMALLTETDTVNAVLKNQPEILQVLEQSHMVPADELAKYKANPQYFELKMRETFDQMKDVFNNPEVMKATVDSLAKFQQALADPTKFYTELNQALTKAMTDLTSDEKIEQARLELLASLKKNKKRGGSDQDDDNDENALNNPLLASMLKSDEMQEILKDPVLWKNSVQQGLGLFQQQQHAAGGRQAAAGIGGAAGMGEL